MTVVDVGACAGGYSLLAARRAARVVAFEPVERNVRLLRRNLGLSGMHNVTIHQMAVCDRVGSILLHEHPGPPRGPAGLSSLMAQVGSTPVEVPSTSLDAMGLQPHVIKIDAEGAEAAVLTGAAAAIARGRPIIFLEVHHSRLPALGSSAEQIHTTLMTWGYQIEVVTDYTSTGGERTAHWLCRPIPLP